RQRAPAEDRVLPQVRRAARGDAADGGHPHRCGEQQSRHHDRLHRLSLSGYSRRMVPTRLPAAFEGRVSRRAAGALLILALLGPRSAAATSDTQQPAATQPTPDGDQKPATPSDKKEAENNDLDRIPDPQPSAAPDSTPAASRSGNQRLYVESALTSSVAR